MLYSLRILTVLLLACTALDAAPKRLDRAVSASLGGRRGTAVVVDVASGRVLASYDIERAVRRRIRPGSAIKPFVLATLIDAGALRDEPGVRCPRNLTIAGRKLNCGHPSDAGLIRAQQALAYSCNTYFTEIGARLTGAQLQQGLMRWGLSSRTGLVRNEALGEIAVGRTREEIQLQSIGEENVWVTPLGLLIGYRRLALERRANQSPARVHSDVFSGMEAATEYGMARLAQPEGVRIHGKPLKVAGKTGTSMAAEGPWTHGWFAGFAPAEHPEIVLVVFLEQGAGPTDAAPVARRIFEAWAAESAR